jgi:hypothetical protein
VLGQENWATRRGTSGCTDHDGSCPAHLGQQPRPKGRTLAAACPAVAALLHVERSGFTAADISPGSSTVLAVWRCDAGHTWRAYPNDLTNGTGSRCSICAGKVVIVSRSLAALAPWLADQWDTDRNRLEATAVAPQSNTRFWWACPLAEDHRWQASPNNRYGKGSGCPMCAGQMPSSTNNLGLYPHLVDEWDVERNCGKRPQDYTRGSKEQLHWNCRKHKEPQRWTASADKRSREEQGCPWCSRNRVSELNSLVALAPELVDQFDVVANGTTAMLVAANSNDEFWWRCPVYPDTHQWKATPNRRYANRTGCPDCNVPGHSAQEVRLAHELGAVLDFDPTVHRVPGLTARVDMWAPQHQLVVEFDGAYWHDGPEAAARDRRKTSRLRAAGVSVVRAREAGLDLLDPAHDVAVPLGAPPFTAAARILGRLVALGLADAGAVDAYTRAGVPVAAPAAEAELRRLLLKGTAGRRRRRRA